MKQCIIRTSQFNSDFLYQFIDILYDYNLFINIYKIAVK